MTTSRLQELAIVDEFVTAVLQMEDNGNLILESPECRILARYLIKVLARDRQKAEQTRRAKIRKALTNKGV